MKTSKCSPFILLFIGILAATVLAGCATLNKAIGMDSFATIPVKELSFPKADYYSIIRVGQALVALTPGENVDYLLLYAKEGDQTLQQITFPKDPNCNIKTAYNIFNTFPDGRVQLWKLCFTDPVTLDYLLAYNWSAQTIEQIAGPLPRGSDNSSWNPEGTRAIIDYDDGFASGTLYWLWKGGFGPADLVINDNGLSWNLKDDFPDFKGAEAGTTGNVGRAAWSPDGHTIAFFASTDAIGKTGFDREAYFKLYLMDESKLQPRPVVDSIHSPFLLAWSPDSTKIAFVGYYGNLWNGGIWLYSLSTNSVIGIAKGDFQSILWTEDGKGLIAIRCKDIHDCSQVEEYDLTNILTP